MSYLGLSDSERRRAIFSLARETTDLDVDRSVGVMRKFVEYIDTLLKEVYKDIDFINLQLNVDTASGFYLENFGNLLDCPRQEATPSSVNLTVSLSENAPETVEIAKDSAVYRLVLRDPGYPQETGSDSDASAASGDTSLRIETGIEFFASEVLRLTRSADNITPSGLLKLESKVTGPITVFGNGANEDSNTEEVRNANTNTVAAQSQYIGVLEDMTGNLDPSEEIVDRKAPWWQEGSYRWNDEEYKSEIHKSWQHLVRGDIPARYESIAKRHCFDAKIERIASATYSNFLLYITGTEDNDIAQNVSADIKNDLEDDLLITTRINIVDARRQENDEIVIRVADDEQRVVIQNITKDYVQRLKIGEHYYEAELYRRIAKAGFAVEDVQIDYDNSEVEVGEFERWYPQVTVEVNSSSTGSLV